VLASAVALEPVTGEDCRIAFTCATTAQRTEPGKPMMKQAVAAVAIGLGTGFAAAPAAHADDDWIAMAISDSTGQIKVTYNGSSEGSAQQTVMQACRKTISDCRLLASGQGGCVAIALNATNSKYYGGWGATRDDAEAAALANARGGNVLKDHTHCQGDQAN